jgi:phospholipase/carboxylesterase
VSGRTAGPPHGGQPVLAAGAPLDRARTVMIMVHGRGASAEDILSLSQEFTDGECAYLAPQAAGFTWYPLPFLSPLAANEPGLSSALGVLGEIEARVNDAGIPSRRIILLGFSQGACLSLEYAARNARRYGGIAGLSGGLIGPDGTQRDYAGSFDGTPVFLGCSVKDPHIPRHRVELTREVYGKLGAEVTMHLYPDPGHTVNGDEVQAVRGMMAALAAG